MSAPRPSSPSAAGVPPPIDAAAERVEAILERVRAGVRQRQAELATLSGGEEVKLRLMELKTLEYVEEPLAVSPRPVVGRLLVLLRNAGFQLFFKGWARPVRERQNRFNQVASGLLHELAADQARLAEALVRTLARLDALEGRGVGEVAAPEPASDDRGDPDGPDEPDEPQAAGPV